MEEIPSYFDWVGSSVINDIETDFAGTFCKEEKRSRLELHRLCKRTSAQTEFARELNVTSEQITNASDLEHFSVRCYQF